MNGKPHMLRVKGWDQFFESAKSKTYGTKQQTYMPNKHGLGYRRIMAHAKGEAIFGAWCSMCQILSRQQKPRQGYLTDTGRSSGQPWTAGDIALLSDFREDTVAEMLAICLTPQVGWIESVRAAKDTTRIPQGDYSIPPGDSPSPSPLPSPSPTPPHIETDLPPDGGKKVSETKKKADKPPAPYRQLTDYFCDKWEEVHHNKYPFRPRDGKAMSEIWEYAEHDFDRGCDVLDNYLACGDKFYAGHPLAKLASDLPKFAADTDNNIFKPRELTEADEAICREIRDNLTPEDFKHLAFPDDASKAMIHAEIMERERLKAEAANE